MRRNLRGARATGSAPAPETFLADRLAHIRWDAGTLTLNTTPSPDEVTNYVDLVSENWDDLAANDPTYFPANGDFGGRPTVQGDKDSARGLGSTNSVQTAVSAITIGVVFKVAEAGSPQVLFELNGASGNFWSVLLLNGDLEVYSNSRKHEYAYTIGDVRSLLITIDRSAPQAEQIHVYEGGSALATITGTGGAASSGNFTNAPVYIAGRGSGISFPASLEVAEFVLAEGAQDAQAAAWSAWTAQHYGVA